MSHHSKKRRNHHNRSEGRRSSKGSDEIPRSRRNYDHRLHDSACDPIHTVFLFNINFKTSMDDLKKFASEFGEFQMIYQPPRKKGMLFITYFDIRNAIRMVDEGSGRVIDGNSIKTAYAYKPPKYANRDSKDICASLFFNSNSGANSSLTNCDMTQAASQFGEIKSINSRDNGKFDVVYYDLRAAKAAYDKKEIVVNGETLKIGYNLSDGIGETPVLREPQSKDRDEHGSSRHHEKSEKHHSKADKYHKDSKKHKSSSKREQATSQYQPPYGYPYYYPYPYPVMPNAGVDNQQAYQNPNLIAPIPPPPPFNSYNPPPVADGSYSSNPHPYPINSPYSNVHNSTQYPAPVNPDVKNNFLPISQQFPNNTLYNSSANQNFPNPILSQPFYTNTPALPSQK